MPASGPLHTPCLARSPALPVATGASHLVSAHMWLPQRLLPSACFYFSTLFLSLHPCHITASDPDGILTTRSLLCNLGQFPNVTVSGLLTCHQVVLCPPCHAAVRAQLRVPQDPTTTTSSCVLPTCRADAEVCFVTALAQGRLVLPLPRGPACGKAILQRTSHTTSPREGLKPLGRRNFTARSALSIALQTLFAGSRTPSHHLSSPPQICFL